MAERAGETSVAVGTRTRSAGAPSTAPDLLPDLLRRRPATVTALLLGATVIAFAALAFDRRWISDDGLIFLRTVRQILDGNGPVFNAGERVEANTSTGWTLVLLALAWLPVRLEYVAVGAGLLLSALALALALDGARRFTGIGRVVAPAGAFVLLAARPFKDFATSGLETGLSFTWLALVWWLLVRRSQRSPRLFTDPAAPAARRRPGLAWPAALVIGLGPLVRPDFALVSVLAAVALAILEQPRGRRGWARLAGLGAVCGALPVGYEVFRAGYYGLLVPAAALAKEAGTSRWAHGFAYLRDAVGTYWMWIPGFLLAVAALGIVWPRLRRRVTPRPEDPDARRALAWDRAGTLAVALVPIVGGVGLALYVVRVGGDFMHARMLLPAIFCVLLPVMALPLRRATVVPLAMVLGWTVYTAQGYGLGPAYDRIGSYGIADERSFYTELLADPNPLTADDYRRHPYVGTGAALVTSSPTPVLVLQARGVGPGGKEWQTVPLPPGEQSTLVWLNLGVAGALTPTDVRVVDTVGLAEPLAGHLETIPGGRVGHDKNLPFSWYMARGGGTPPDGRTFPPEDVASASRALRCPALVDLEASVRAPMTPARFWANLVGAPERTALRYPRDPVLAERALCR